uniref:Uncharacterized protein n=1 Tax=Ixodes ricinus TaxID=34613 RepID=A0A6B0UUF7_IXORI
MNLWSLTSKTFFFFRAPLRALSLKPSIGCSRPSSFSSAMSAGVAAVVAFFFFLNCYRLQSPLTALGGSDDGSGGHQTREHKPHTPKTGRARGEHFPATALGDGCTHGATNGALEAPWIGRVCPAQRAKRGTSNAHAHRT